MKPIRSYCAVAVALLALVAASPALAVAVWTSPVDGGEIVTPYASVYAGKTHRGVDIAAPAGSSVAAPADGQVVFAGRVPADGGGTCGAVTIELADGLRVSCLPLADVVVEQGGHVTAGETVGTLAPTGDDSSPEPHLHLGLRRGDEYLDPTGLLPEREPATAIVPSVPSAPAARTGGTGSGDLPSASVDDAVPVGLGGDACVAAAPWVPTAAATPAAVPGPAPHPVHVPHPVPEAAGAPAASQVIVASPAADRALRVRASGVVGAAPAPATLVAPGALLVVAGAFGLSRQLAHGTVR